MAISAGAIGNMAPSRAMQLSQVATLLAPPLFAMLAVCPQRPEIVVVELSIVLYGSFMMVISGQVHRDYVVGVQQQVRLAAHADELERARCRAEDSSRAKSEFLANMSHEIRTPLNGVLGMAQVLAFTELTFEQRESVNTILQSGEGLLAVLSDVLDFSKIESRKLLIEPVVFSPALLGRQIIALFEHTARPKGLELNLFLSPRLPASLCADQLRLRQILLNLVSNALKFTSAGQVSLSMDYQEDTLRCEVRDSGQGMSPEAVGRLFQPFVQGDASTTRKFGGTGLGLAISRELAGLMGGHLSVVSTLGAGSTFGLSLPAPRAEVPVAVADEQPAPRPAPDRVRVLVAEDNPVNQQVAVRLLEKLGCTTSVASNGVEVLQRLDLERFDLVLMDCQMPQLDGYQTTRAIRERSTPSAFRVPIVGLTASAIDGDRERALACGMDGYLTKPVKLALLDEVITRHCRSE